MSPSTFAKQSNSRNTAVFAVAGAAKTQRIVDEVVRIGGHRTLVTTYTNVNIDELRERITTALGGSVPKTLEIISWQAFLFRHGIQPYQAKWSGVPNQIRGIYHAEKPDPSLRRFRKSDPLFFRTNDLRARGERLGHLVLEIARCSGGAWRERLEGIFDNVFIDEFQDIAGYDLDVAKEIFRSGIRTLIVGDEHQSTFRTTTESRHKQYRGRIEAWLNDEQIACRKEQSRSSYRCCQEICDFANKLIPGLKMESSCSPGNQIAGVYVVLRGQLDSYLDAVSPQALRWSKITNVDSRIPIMNMAASKGRTFGHVLIYPTEAMRRFLCDGNVEHLAGSKKTYDARTRLYIAATRARFSVAFFLDREPRSLAPLARHWGT